VVYLKRLLNVNKWDGVAKVLEVVAAYFRLLLHGSRL